MKPLALDLGSMWLPRLIRRFEQFTEHQMELAALGKQSPAADKALCHSIQELKAPIPEALYRLFVVIAEFEYEIQASKLPLNLDLSSDEIFGPLFKSVKPLLLKDYLSRQRILRRAQKELYNGNCACTGSRDLSLYLRGEDVSQTRRIVLSLEDTIFHYLPPPALIHATVKVKDPMRRLLWSDPVIDIKCSLEKSLEKRTAETGKAPGILRMPFEEIIAIEAEDPFNIFVIKRIAQNLLTYQTFSEAPSPEVR